MIPPEEESFPRGRRKVEKTVKRALPADDNLFGPKKGSKAKKSKKSVAKEPQTGLTEDGFQAAIRVDGSLSYKKIKEDMIILGCIRNITNFALEIELPGLIFGQVTITNISDQFTKYLNKRLKDADEDMETDFLLKNMFQIGQFVVVKVLQIESGESRVKVQCTLSPSEINSGKNMNSFKKNMLIWACVQSVLDHGYELSVGVKNCRVFLPQEQVDKGKSYTVGEPLWCVVHKHTEDNVASTLRVSAKLENISKTKIEEIEGLNDVIPGMQVDFVSEKIVESGIQGKYLDNYFGYVNENFLKKSLQKVEDYAEGKLFKAFVLYIEPTTKITHLSLRNFNQTTEQVYKTGDVVKAQVYFKNNLGLIFKIGDNHKGFVTNKRLLNCFPKSTAKDFSGTILTKFPLQSEHNCRILDYNHLTQLYVVTVETSLVKQNYFSSEDLELGLLLKVTIDKIKPEGFVVSAGGIKGFIPNFHICNSQFSENIKKKYSVGTKISARVFSVNEEGNVLFTMKQGLVESDKCLTKFNETITKQKYPGVIVSTKPNSAVVCFYGNLKGVINKRHLDAENEDVDLTKYFQRGQVVNVWIIRMENNKLHLSLKEPTGNEAVTAPNIRIGDITAAIVNNIESDKIDVTTTNGKVVGIIPVNHLSPALNLCRPLHSTYKVGDKIKDLMCINNRVHPVIFSRREGIRNKKKGPIKLFKQIKRGNIVRCLYDSSDNSGIYVTVLTKDYHQKVLIPKSDLFDASQVLEPQQSLLAKVLNIDRSHKTLKLSTKVQPSVDYATSLFAQILADMQHLRNVGKEKDWSLCEYDPGERVTCTVKKNSKIGCAVTLPNGCHGLVPQPLCEGSLKEGKTTEGVILAHDLTVGCYYLCLNKNISKLIGETQDGETELTQKSSCLVEKILETKTFILTVLRQSGGKNQLVYIPLSLNENDFGSTASYYKQKKFKVALCGKIENCLIGISRKLFIKLEKERQKTETEILKRKNSENKKSSSNDDNDEKEETDEDENNLIEEQEESELESEEEQDVEELDEEESELEEKESEDESVEENDSADEFEQDQKTSKTTKRKLEETSTSSVLPGISSFFGNKQPTKESDDSSSDEEEETEIVKKKKKLSRAERAEQLRLDEERISKIEKRFADNNVEPESADDFDRLVTANPNSAELWTRYMAFHISSTEIDKARTVAKKALENISITLLQERLNIWIALLHLENSYGSKDTFEQVFNEAIKCNDSLQVYLRVIEMLAENCKLAEMEQNIRKVKNKYKQEPTMWIEVAKVYYKLKQFKDARNMKDAALKSILDKKTQMSLIVRFAIMEFKHGEPEHGSAIFESIINADPRKVNIWSTYVDQLVKNGNIDQARKILERSVCQKLPVKSMRSLFLKFRKFEEEHGTPDTVAAVKEKATEYMKKVNK